MHGMLVKVRTRILLLAKRFRHTASSSQIPVTRREPARPMAPRHICEWNDLVARPGDTGRAAPARCVVSRGRGS